MYVNMGVYDRMRLDECGVSRGFRSLRGTWSLVAEDKATVTLGLENSIARG